MEGKGRMGNQEVSAFREHGARSARHENISYLSMVVTKWIPVSNCSFTHHRKVDVKNNHFLLFQEVSKRGIKHDGCLPNFKLKFAHTLHTAVKVNLLFRLILGIRTC